MGDFDFVDYHKRLQAEITGALQEASDDLLPQVIADVINTAEDVLADNLTAVDHEMLACSAGCSHCCIINVAVLLPEAINIANHLRHSRTADELAQLNNKMHKLVTAISGLDNEERIALRKSCVFLDQQGLCSIYPVRPLLCRAVTSISADDCCNALAMQAFGENVPVTMNLLQKNLFDVTYQALATALAQAEIDDVGYELTAAVLQQLSSKG